MERGRATWTDERLDDLSRRLDAGFTRVDEGIGQLRAELTARFDGLQRLLIQLFGAMFVGILGTVATVLAAT